ncbi:Glycosyltransferase involved in cell wall bisynthesis [Ruminococcaceae bacterium KH2T8]|nr:Glycosyltransferase involved in cell wall bisynthesis [Ruminococcaceae bacterium KH2T8]
MSKILTVSIAAYNVGEYLDNTLKSLVDDDSLDKLEVLIVNDGSSDNTTLIAHEYEKRYPGVFYAIDKENGGYGSTINAAIAKATGKYFKILDGDDWYKTENLSGFISFLEKSEADIVISPYILFNESTQKESIVDKRDLRVSNLDAYYAEDGSVFRMHEMCIRTNLLLENKVTITENCFYTDNEYVFIPLLYANTVDKYIAPVYVYRVGYDGQSVSLSGRKKHWQDAAVVEKKLLECYKSRESQLSAASRGALSELLLELAEYQLINYCLIDDISQGKKELVEFDAFLKNSDSTLYKKISVKNKKVCLLRITNYLSYGLVRKMFISYFSKNQAGCS